MQPTDYHPREQPLTKQERNGIFLIVLLLMVFVITIYIGDYLGTITVLIGLLVTVCFVFSSGRPTRSRSVLPFVALMNSELAKSTDPENQFGNIIDNMLKQRKLSHDEISKILTAFSHQDSKVGILASKMLSEIA
ncbi:MAG: hypothetical protein ACFFD6_03185 [Candidatus Thorarchaeota archaeon]